MACSLARTSRQQQSLLQTTIRSPDSMMHPQSAQAIGTPRAYLRPDQGGLAREIGSARSHELRERQNIRLDPPMPGAVTPQHLRREVTIRQPTIEQTRVRSDELVEAGRIAGAHVCRD